MPLTVGFFGKFYEPEGAERSIEIPGGLKITMWATAAATIILGRFPGLVLDWATRFSTLNK